ncbi:hypothetical protein [Caldivirga sp.]|uniref:hypothetical protein n=1 Tax=Caldivirga sp. TaxID=2080243 RepID=UPI0025BC622D|nr:hypothetical protein [Caldivirga sp.]
MRVYPPTAVNTTDIFIAWPQMKVNCIDRALNIVYTCINRSSIVNNYVPGICLLRVNESNGVTLNYGFFSSIYSNKSTICMLYINFPSLMFNIVNNSVYVISMGSSLTWYFSKIKY